MARSAPSPRAAPVPTWLPNALTVLRIALIPAFLAQAHWCARSVADGGSDQPHRALAMLALGGIGVSDVLDGWVARRYGLDTALGATLDALADKLAQFSLLLFFFLSDDGAFVKVPLWFVALVFGRDLLLAVGTLLVRVLVGRVAVVHVTHGKLTSFALFVLLGWVTLDMPRAPVGPAMFAISVLVALSTFDYVKAGWSQWVEARSRPQTTP